MNSRITRLQAASLLSMMMMLSACGTQYMSDDLGGSQSDDDSASDIVTNLPSLEMLATGAQWVGIVRATDDVKLDTWRSAESDEAYGEPFLTLTTMVEVVKEYKDPLNKVEVGDTLWLEQQDGNRMKKRKPQTINSGETAVVFTRFDPKKINDQPATVFSYINDQGYMTINGNALREHTTKTPGMPKTLSAFELAMDDLPAEALTQSE